MKSPENNEYTKRIQKDYSLSFKLQLVEEIEQGHLTKIQAKTTFFKSNAKSNTNT